MKTTAFLTLAAAALAITQATPIAKISDSSARHSVPLTRNPTFKHNTKAQIARLNLRYPGINILSSSGTVPISDVNRDLEYYGTVSVGTPGQDVRLDFDTGSADIWFPSSTCIAPACKAHNSFNPTKSSTFQQDGRPWNISYGDNSNAGGMLGSDIVNVGGIAVRQTVGLTTNESPEFGKSPEDGIFGLGFSTIESVNGVQTFMDSAIAANILTQPVVSVFLPSQRLFKGQGGEYIFGGIDSSKYTGDLTYVPLSVEGYWQVAIDNIAVGGQNLGFSSQGIIDTGTTLIILSDDAAAAVHQTIPGAISDPAHGWQVPCSLTSSTDSISFIMAGKPFNVAVADLVYEPLQDGSGFCTSGVQGGLNALWVLGDVFIKNNYCVFSKTSTPSIGMAPLKV
ncbi:hypothetical protein EDD11_000033 [Mortierella claussenii]|nr:hypothetical protein EDD11_000033 [Mortierella claussenii]